MNGNTAANSKITADENASPLHRPLLDAQYLKDDVIISGFPAESIEQNRKPGYLKLLLVLFGVFAVASVSYASKSCSSRVSSSSSVSTHVLRARDTAAVTSTSAAAVVATTTSAAVAAITSVAPAVDLVVLNFALTLEHLEATFYKTGLAKFNAEDFEKIGLPPTVFKTFQTIGNDEAVHVQTLQAVILAKFGVNLAVPACTYNFQTALATVQNFVTFAAILERTGVEAYDGGIHLIVENDVKNAAAAIATVEGRHSAFLDLLTIGVPAPGPFDTPLGIRPIITIASGLITKCNYTLPAVPFPVLTTTGGATVTASVKVNSTITLTSPALLAPAVNIPLFCDWAFGLQQTRTPVKIVYDAKNVTTSTCQVPAAIKQAFFSQAILFVVNANTDVLLDNDQNVIAGPATVYIKH
ncbi:hypothetical protein HK100_001970 [Physocladia obscura]|uniref:Uncharacterized protein n=1 Tax=Physocladia obscura TaxID=109957 RepID=A0AAD5SW10_9FUNG|nr:hypothetical protein HK100_001970 [Physocladia obscura]